MVTYKWKREAEKREPEIWQCEKNPADVAGFDGRAKE